MSVIDMYYNNEINISDLLSLYDMDILEDHINLEVQEILKENNLLSDDN